MIIEWVWMLVSPTGAVMPTARFDSEAECVAIELVLARRNLLSDGYWMCLELPVTIEEEE